MTIGSLGDISLCESFLGGLKVNKMQIIFPQFISNNEMQNLIDLHNVYFSQVLIQELKKVTIYILVLHYLIHCNPRYRPLPLKLPRANKFSTINVQK